MKVHFHNLDVSKRNVKKHLSQSLEISCSNVVMDIYENRRRWVAYWIATDFGGERRRAEESTGYSRSQLAQFLSTTYQDGESPGERAARNIEKKFNKPARIMETPAPAASEFPPAVATGAAAQAPNAARGSATLGPVPDSADAAVARIAAKITAALESGVPYASLEKASGIFDVLTEVHRANMAPTRAMDRSGTGSESAQVERGQSDAEALSPRIKREQTGHDDKTGTTGGSR